MSLFHLRGLKGLPPKLQSVPNLEHLTKFHLDLRRPRYKNYPYVFCLGMNPGRGWNPDLEETYLPEYSEYEAETFTQCTSKKFLRTVKFLTPDPSPISRYNESTKTTSFSILGFFKPGVKLGFDFPGISPNQIS